MTRARDLGADAATHPDSPRWPARPTTGFRRAEVTTQIGAGDDLWRRASRDVLRWAVKTRSGFTVHGEEAFIVHRSDDAVSFTVRSLTAPAPSGGWRWVFPLLRVAQVVARRRYLRALR